MSTTMRVLVAAVVSALMLTGLVPAAAAQTDPVGDAVEQVGDAAGGIVEEAVELIVEDVFVPVVQAVAQVGQQLLNDAPQVVRRFVCIVIPSTPCN